MSNEIYEMATDLILQGEPFATVTVVRNEAPSSGKTGDKAIVNKTGVLKGWVGGGCVYSIVLKEVTEALEDGKPRLVRVSPTPSSAPSRGVKEYKMTCYSGGEVDLYIEPVMPKPHLVIIGKSIIGRALMKAAKAIDFRLTVINEESNQEVFPEADHHQTAFNLEGISFNKHTFIVVATQGDNDERGLQTALGLKCRYVGFIASRKKRDGVFANLLKLGLSQEQLDEVHAPAGIDINGKTPQEVAISILAEIIQEYRSKEVAFESFSVPVSTSGQPPSDVQSGKPQIITNPVCGMPISLGMAKYIIEQNGEPIYFCCDGCKIKFDAEPEKYLIKG
ncbi:MAG TPA: XdhC family protein [Haliscomenobacter sp.]|uniref:XdhC family protein n=1 Tax=Haliscomenobacter sp. TaxID=2717303 RepID=UPI002B7FECBE|nr:XdhC family protein [Haliscomenobacter sp.]HOY19648.1 XdhC family protein [Haliscomenobacter sp.]